MSKKLETLGLIEVTSQRQADNGTICYHDPVTKCDYISYESGYVRRSYKTKAWLSGKEITNIYQLNPKRKVAGRWGAITERILINDHDSRVDLIARATINYRKTIDKNFLNKNILTEFEKTLLEGMNRRAMLIVKTEEFLQEQKISFNKEILYGLPDDTLRDLCENWNPENQKKSQKKY